jgi:integrase
MPFRTQTAVDGLRLPKGKLEDWQFDERCTGLSVRLQGRARSWIVWYAVGGKRRKIKIGDVAGMRLEEARRQATEIVNGAKAGRDPMAEREHAHEAAAARQADSLGRLVETFLERHARPRQKPRSFAECQRSLQVHWRPLHPLPVDAVTRKHVATRLEEIRRERGASAAKNAKGYLCTCYSWAMRAGLADVNPTIGTPEVAVPASKARVLRPEELAMVWRAAGECGQFGVIVLLLMLLGCRRSEIAAAAWGEFDLERRLWVIPATRAKNARECEIYLCDQVLAILPERRPGRELLFGRGEQAFSGYSNAKVALDKKISKLNGKALKPWRLHDLRHSFVTHAAELGIEPHIIEACVNHQSGHKAGIAGRYNAAQYRQQKAAAFARFADWLMDMVEGREPESNVVQLTNPLAS